MSDVVDAAAEQAGVRLPGGGRVLLTPRYADSRHVVVLLVDGRGRPGVVAKVVRMHAHESSLPAEAAALRAVAGTTAAACAPLLLGLAEVDGHRVLLQSAVGGRTVLPRDVAGDPRGWSARVDRLLRDLLLPRDVSPAAGGAWFAGWAGDVLDLAERALEGRPADADLLDRVRAVRPVLESVAAAGLPAAVEHGDLGHPNLLWERRSGRLALVDWENGRPAGLAGCDAAFFASFVAFAVAGARGPQEQQQAYAAMLRDGGVAREWLGGHLRGLGADPALAGPLLHATWARAALAVMPRMLGHGALAAAGAGVPLDATRVDRAVAVLRTGLPLRLWSTSQAVLPAG